MEQQYFSDQAPASEDDLRTIFFEVRGHDLQMSVSPKVFSTSKLDLGTRQLLNEAPSLPEEGTFLDLGCGWGPIAVTMGLESPAAKIWAVDVNSRAIDLTKRNANTNGLTHLTAELSEEALDHARKSGTTFDVIWSNPPVRIGKAAMHQMLIDWLSLLSNEGVAYLVMQRNLGADSLIAWLNGQGFASSKIASKKGYRIIEVRPRS
ncbi:class I SAM-dependent methyltransferase [Schaalia vaccimaxillae]|uniref:class I SAM-dependent methyltransferase n=1 Tax=Schaalia vaccimaxillae TaxID=183916 RepID=UPI0003B3C54B|nr:methyltransferase [Schaalia vaccimaxillae]